MNTQPPKKTGFNATYTGEGRDKGRVYRWHFWKEQGHWMLRDHDGYIRTMEQTWTDSVPMIRLIVANYGMTCNIS